jgi:hypothetical protein
MQFPGGVVGLLQSPLTLVRCTSHVCVGLHRAIIAPDFAAAPGKVA